MLQQDATLGSSLSHSILTGQILTGQIPAQIPAGPASSSVADTFEAVRMQAGFFFEDG